MGEDILESEDLSMEEVLRSDSSNELEEGKIILGEIVKIDTENVFVDVSLKSEGIIPLSEFIKGEQQLDIKKGDKIEVYLMRKEFKSGSPLLSFEKAQEIKINDKLIKSNKTGEYIEGTVTKKIKGGLCVNIGKDSFLPRSQIGLSPIADLDQFVGKKITVKITKLSLSENDIVVSSRLVLEEERKIMRDKRFAAIKDGEVCNGIIKNITEFGAFIDIGGIDGLLHKKDISWGRVRKIEDFLKVGEEIEVKVLSFDTKTQKVSLGLKQLTPHPWENIEEKYSIGSLVSGRVTNITDFGFFITIEEGVEGLVHISEISWTEKIRHASKVVSKGDLVEARILNIDKDAEKISLGIKQITPNPWDKIKENYSVGMNIVGKITNITPFGAFVGLEEGVEGLIHVKDMSWTKKINHPNKILKKGECIEAIILELNPMEEKIVLGLKQTSTNPYLAYKKGDNVKGQITKVTDFGVFVKIEEGIEGLVHISQVSEEYITTVSDIMKIGEEVYAKIIDINYSEGKISLSIKEYNKEQEKEEIKKYMQSPSLKISLGDVLGGKLNKIRKNE